MDVWALGASLPQLESKSEIRQIKDATFMGKQQMILVHYKEIHQWRKSQQIQENYKEESERLYTAKTYMLT